MHERDEGSPVADSRSAQAPELHPARQLANPRRSLGCARVEPPARRGFRQRASTGAQGLARTRILVCAQPSCLYMPTRMLTRIYVHRVTLEPHFQHISCNLTVATY